MLNLAKYTKFVFKTYLKNNLQVTKVTRKNMFQQVLKISLMRITSKKLWVEKVSASIQKYRKLPALTGTQNELDVAQILY